MKYIKKYIDVEWLEEKVSSSERTHILLYLLSIRENIETNFLETILKELNDQIDLEGFFNRIKNDYLSFFDVLSELSLLSIFLSQDITLNTVEYELPNGKFLDFLFEKEDNQILIEVMNIRPYVLIIPTLKKKRRMLVFKNKDNNYLKKLLSQQS